jgi:hypothetical protein
MADVWDAMIEQGKHEWLVWTATRPGVFSDSTLRKLACRFIRETPLSDGRKVWDLLTDERCRRAVEVAELYADGKATAQELAVADAAAARDAARAAAYAAASAAARAVARAADTAAYAAAYAASDDAADAADTAAYAAAAAVAYAAASAAASAVYAAASAAAKAAQVRMIAELGNPFKKERESNENERLFETA